MEKSDLIKIEATIEHLSDRFQKALVSASGPQILVSIKRELEYWKQMRNRSNRVPTPMR